VLDEGTEFPIDSDGIISKLQTMIMPQLVRPNEEPGIMVHIDDCFCERCESERGSVAFATTILVEITNNKNTMITRLLPGEARTLGLALIEQSVALYELREQGCYDDVK
jgi:hypothetical protein|tara:strand:- start:4467 stop:4793 length:327 start_codon:yes stop_codon:yes gene_type:complete